MPWAPADRPCLGIVRSDLRVSSSDTDVVVLRNERWSSAGQDIS